MKRLLLALLVVLIAIPVAFVATSSWWINGTILRDRIEAAAARATGRKLTIAGPIQLAWSLTPTITLHDISLSNPPGFAQQPMLHVDQAEAQVALGALLARRLEIDRIEIDRPSIRLARDAAGRGNWTFNPPAAPPGPAGSEPHGPRVKLRIGAIEITGAKIAWGNVPEARLTLPDLRYRPDSGALDGLILDRGISIALGGAIGQDGQPGVPVSLKAESQGASLALQGRLSLPTTPPTSQLTVTADIPRLDRFAPLFSAPLPLLSNLHLATKLGIRPDGADLSGLTLTSDQGDLAGTLTLADAGKPSVSGTLHANRLGPIAWTASAPPPAAPVQAAPATVPVESARPIPDTALPFAALTAFDADLHLVVTELDLPGRALHGLDATMRVQNGSLRADPVTLAIGDKPLEAHLAADAANKSVSLTLSGKALPAGPALALFGGPAAATGSTDIQADLHGTGATLSALLATIDGWLGFALVDADIPDAWLQHALVASGIPVDLAGASQIHCAALRADAKAGQVDLRALALDTGKLSLTGAGRVDLGGQTLDLSLSPRLRLGSAITVPIRLRGPIGAPKIALDRGAFSPDRVGITLGGPAPDICPAALALARNLLAPTPPTSTPAAPPKPLKPADLLRRLLR